MTDEREAKKMRFTGEMVIIEVGNEGSTTLKVHADMIKADSEFFRLALDKKWKEGSELKVSLPEDDVDVFTDYVTWLYDNDKSLASVPDSLAHAKLYVLGEKIQSPKLCNAAVSAIHKSVRREVKKGEFDISVPSIDAVNVIFNGTMPDSGARQLMVDEWSVYGEPDWLYDGGYYDPPHPDFVMALAVAFLRRAQEDYKYHDEVLRVKVRESWYKKV